ncbi:MAG: hypothetical protein ACI8QT_001492 [Halioglobus sp.]|jgi:hypothetical protein
MSFYNGAPMRRFIIIMLLAIPLATVAQVYKSVDENGSTVYSDTPPANGSNAEKVDVGATNISPPPRLVDRPAAVVKQKEIDLAVDITSPVHDTTIAIGFGGNFSVTAAVNPPLGNGNSAQLLMDGTAIGPPQIQPSWALSNIFRGSHRLTVVISNAAGEKLAESTPITVHVLRTSVGR